MESTASTSGPLNACAARCAAGAAGPEAPFSVSATSDAAMVEATSPAAATFLREWGLEGGGAPAFAFTAGAATGAPEKRLSMAAPLWPERKEVTHSKK